MRYLKYDVVFQEVPGEISLCFWITGCSIRCGGCNSQELWDEQAGEDLISNFDGIFKKYYDFISCVLFMGGEKYKELFAILEKIQKLNKKTALYTGREFKNINSTLLKNLNYIKVNPFNEHLGPLNSPTTNQKFYSLKDGKIDRDLTSTFYVYST